MPKSEPWDNLPDNILQHLIDRMRDREISIADLICGSRSYPKTFLSRGQVPKGEPL
jgi:hypothetical protein